MGKKKYFKIYHDIANKIQNNQLKPNTLLPSEHLLTREYDASRGTIRRALQLLADKGFIHTKKGKGSFVLDTTKVELPISGLVSFSEVASNSTKEWETTVHELEKQKLGKYPFAKDVFEGEPNDTNIWKMIRSRETEKETVILDIDYLLGSKITNLSKKIGEKSLYDYIEKELGLTISFAEKKIVVEKVTELDQKYLDLNGTEYVVVMKSHVYLDDVTRFQYHEARHRLDKFTFVDFARRNKYE